MAQEPLRFDSAYRLSQRQTQQIRGWRRCMPQQPERFDVLVLGSGTGGKLTAWHLARSGQRTAVVERQWIGGACPNIACMPSKNEIRSAEVAHLARHGAEFGTMTGSVVVDMATVRRRKREMVERQVAKHLDNYKASGAELIMGSGRFVAPKTLEVSVHGGGTRAITAEKIFLNLGTHAAVPSVPGLAEVRPLTHIEALELDYLPPHLIVIGGGYSGLELAQAYRRFGSNVTIIESGPQLMGREDIDVSQEIRRILAGEGIQAHVTAELLNVRGRSGDKVSLQVRTPSGEQKIEGSDILVAAGRIPNTAGIGLEQNRREGGQSRLHPRQRTPGNNRGRHLGARGMRRQSAIHARVGGRFSNYPGQSKRRKSQHARPTDPILHVHRSSAGPCWTE
jgi:pyruvate/2-oxoglutarate dehydrogenase complex dihydrolipoamide dehydrogenase (E3) component